MHVLHMHGNWQHCGVVVLPAASVGLDGSTCRSSCQQLPAPSGNMPCVVLGNDTYPDHGASM